MSNKASNNKANKAEVYEFPVSDNSGNFDIKTDAMTISFSKNGKSIVFNLPNEQAQQIDLSNPQPYRSEDKKFIETARAVKKQKSFGEINLKNLTEKYPFVPFEYQLKNVEIMLNRFNGKGVFGDQVGLGKTVEALITAHAMFESGSIRNALIIVPDKLVDSWEREIKTKFPGVFLTRVYRYREGEETFIELINDMRDCNANRKPGNHIFLASEKVVKGNEEDILHYDIHRAAAEIYEKALDSTESAQMKSLCAEIKDLDVTGRTLRLKKLLGENGFYDYASVMGDSIGKILSTLTIEKCNLVIEALDGLSRRMSEYLMTYRNIKDYQETVREVKELIFGKIEEMRETLTMRDRYRGIGDVGNDRIVDLMIVDEIHTFYESYDIDSYVNDRSQIEYSWEKVREAVSFIAKINKKFCVLISATPIRARLEDIFQLVYIADSEKFGESYDAARDYFYSTICRIDPEAKTPLSDMIFLDGGFESIKAPLKYNDDKFANFIGLINNFFTRKRISDVEEQMKGMADIPFEKWSDQQKAFINKGTRNSLYEKILHKRKLMYMQSRADEATAAREAADSFEQWKKYGLSLEPKRTYDSRRHMRSAIDEALIEAFNRTGSYSDRERRTLHSMIDWRRRKKSGIGIVAESSARGQDEAIVNAVSTLHAKLDGICDELEVIENKEQLAKILEKITVSEDRVRDIDNEKYLSDNADGIWQVGADLQQNLVYGTVAYYVGGNDENNEDIVESIADKLKKVVPENVRQGSRNVVIARNSGSDFAVTETSFNKVVLLNKTYQAGFNLQSYRTLVFSQMDLAGAGLLEPVDIEQWIGRIYRTGQTRNCKIVSILTTYMDESNRNPDPKFLKWYYDIISDPDGFDLYGNTTPDVAFLQPIVTDCLRKHLTKKYPKIDVANSYHRVSFERVWNKTRLASKTGVEISSKVINSLSFAEAMEFYYYMAKGIEAEQAAIQLFIKQLVAKLCEKKEFGKRKQKTSE